MATFDRRLDKDGKYVHRARVRRKGYAPQVATFHKLSDARKWAQVTEAAMLEGRHFKTTAAKSHTLADLIDRYIHEVLPQKGHSSIYMQTQQLTWWKKQLGHCILADLTPALVAEYRDKLARGDEVQRANSTVNRYLAALSHAFTIAVKEWGWLGDSPMRKVRKPKEPRGRVRFLSDDERKRLLDVCRESDSQYLYTIVALALATGACKMELLNLTWQDVDLKRGVITLHETKNGERRILPLTGHALALMREHASRQCKETSLIFPSQNGKAARDIRTAWRHTVKRAGITNFRYHDLRHNPAYLFMLCEA